MGHLAVIRQALLTAEIVMIVIGSANAARRFDYVPFTAAEREAMLRMMLTAEENQRVRFVHTEDQGNMPKWSGLIRAAAYQYERDDSQITLIGHAKDRSSFYLKAFPGWNSSDVDNYMGLSATNYRNNLFGGDFITNLAGYSRLWKDTIHPDVRDWLVDFAKTEAFDYMVRESAFVDQYRKDWGPGPHVTADLICIQGDYVLTVDRGKMPFQGLIAAPGGFVEPDERVVDAAFREGAEETDLKVPEMVLRRNIITTEFYDDPFRDPRGRVYTFATLVYLNPQPPANMVDPKEIRKYLQLPRIAAGDDAAAAKWRHIPSIRRDQTAFDFYNMLHNMVELIPNNG